MAQLDRCDDAAREWERNAVAMVEADANRSADTHLLPFPLPPAWGIDLYLKDESVHPTGSLKHRLARSLFLYGLCNGWIHEHTTVVDASSGSTAVSEAYFARFLGLPVDGVVLNAKSVKQNSCDLRDLVEDYEALARELVGTALADELADRGM